MASNSIMDYLKNVGQSVKFAAIESVSEKTPNLQKVFGENNKKYIQELYKDVNQHRQELNMIDRIRNATVFKQISVGWDNLKDSIKTGKFKDDSRSTGFDEMEMMFAMMGDDFLGGDSDLIEAEMNGEETGSTNEHRIHGIPEITKGDALVATASATATKNAASSITKAIVRSAELTDITTRKSTNLQLRALQQQANILTSGFQQLASSLHTINQFNSQVVLTHAQNSRIFFEQATSLAQERNAILKEMLEMQRETFGATMRSNLSSDAQDLSKISKIFDKEKGFDLRAYVNLMQKKMKETPIGMMMMSIKMLPMMIGEVVQNPMHYIAKMGIDSIIDNSLKKAINNIDASINGFIATGLAKLANYGKDKATKNTLLGQIARFFGIRNENTRLSAIDTSKYNKEAIQWNGIAQKALVEVIPGHLRRIEAALTGEGERVFDLQSGKWSTMKNVANIEKDIDRKIFKDTFSKEKNQLLNMMHFNSRDEMRGWINALDSFFKGVKNRGMMDYNHIRERSDEYGDNENLVKAIAYLIHSGGLDSSQIFNLTNKINEGNARKAAMIRDLSPANQSLINEATNNSYNAKWAAGAGSIYGANGKQKVDKNGRWLSMPFNDLTKLIDTRGYTLYDYQYNILQTLLNMQRRGGGIGGGGRPTGPVGPVGPSNGGIPVPNIQNTIAGGLVRTGNTFTNTVPAEAKDPNSAQRQHARSLVEKAQAKSATRRATYHPDYSGLDEEEKLNYSIDRIKNAKSEEELAEILVDLQYAGSVSKEYRANKKVASSGGIFGDLKSAARGLGVSSVDSFMADMQEATSIADKFNVVGEALRSMTSAPQKILTSVLTEADRFMYEFMFGNPAGTEKDDNGQPIEGFFGKVTHEFGKTMDNLNNKFNEWFKDTFKKGAGGIAGFFKGVLEDYFNIDVDEKVEQAKRHAKKYANKVRKGALSAGADLFGIAKEAVLGTAQDLGVYEPDEEEKKDNKQTPPTASRGIKKYSSRYGIGVVGPGEKIISPGRGKVLDNTTGYKAYALQYGDSVIPSYLNPSNAGRGRVTAQSLASQDYNEKALANSIARGNVPVLGTFSGAEAANNYHWADEQEARREGGPTLENAKSKRGFFHNFRNWMTGYNEPEFTEDQIKMQEFIKDIVNSATKAAIEANGGMFEDEESKGRSITQAGFEMAGKLRRGNVDLNTNEFQEALKEVLAMSENIKDPDFRDTLKFILNTAGYQGEFDTVDESKKVRRSRRNNLFVGVNQFMDAAFGIDSKKAIDTADKTIRKNLPELAKGGTFGALLSTVLPLGGPLMGALVGAGASVLTNSKSFQSYMFGSEITDANGNVVDRKNDGIISRKTVKTIQRYLPDAKKYGITGALTGLILPFGPLGGMMIGAGASFLKNNSRFQEFMFGEEGGLINKDRKERIKRALPNIGVATLGTLFLGPFGIMGNAMLGAGLGILSTTESFKRIMLGAKDKNGVRRGGLADIIRRQITDPFKKTMDDAKTRLAAWFKDDIFNPLAKTIKPLARVMAGEVKDIARKAADFVFGKKGEGQKSIFGRLGLKSVDRMLGLVRNAGGLGAFGLQQIGNMMGKGAHWAERNIGQRMEKRAFRKGYIEGDTTAQERLDRAEELGVNADDANQYALGGLDKTIANISAGPDSKTKLQDLSTAISMMQDHLNGTPQTINRQIVAEKDNIESMSEKAYQDYMRKNPNAKNPHDMHRTVEKFINKMNKIGASDDFDLELSKGEIAKELADSDLPEEVKDQLMAVWEESGSNIDRLRKGKAQLNINGGKDAYKYMERMAANALGYEGELSNEQKERIKKILQNPNALEAITQEQRLNKEKEANDDSVNSQLKKQLDNPADQLITNNQELQINELQVMNSTLSYISNLLAATSQEDKDKIIKEFQKTMDKYNGVAKSEKLQKTIEESKAYANSIAAQKDKDDFNTNIGAGANQKIYNDRKFNRENAYQNDRFVEIINREREEKAYLGENLDKYIESIEPEVWKLVINESTWDKFKRNAKELAKDLSDDFTYVSQQAGAAIVAADTYATNKVNQAANYVMDNKDEIATKIANAPLAILTGVLDAIAKLGDTGIEQLAQINAKLHGDFYETKENAITRTLGEFKSFDSLSDDEKAELTGKDKPEANSIKAMNNTKTTSMVEDNGRIVFGDPNEIKKQEENKNQEQPQTKEEPKEQPNALHRIQEGIKEKAKETKDEVKETLKEEVEKIKETTKELVIEPIKDAVTKVKDELESLANSIKTTAQLFSKFGNPMSNIEQDLTDKDTPPTATYGLPFFGTFAGGAAVAGAAAKSGSGSLIGSVLKGALGGAKDYFTGGSSEKKEEPSNNIKEVQQSAPTAGEVKSTAGMVAQFDHSKANGGAPDINTKDNVEYTSDSEGNPVAITKGPDGTPMKLHNKDNEELEKKHNLEFSFKERSANALEAIAARLGAKVKGAGKAVAAAGGGLLGGLLDSIGGLINTLFLGLPVGTWLIGKLKSLPGKLFKLLGKLVPNSIKKFGADLMAKVTKLPGKLGELVGRGFASAKSLVGKKLGQIAPTLTKNLVKLLSKSRVGALLLGGGAIAAGGLKALGIIDDDDKTKTPSLPPGSKVVEKEDGSKVVVDENGKELDIPAEEVESEEDSGMSAGSLAKTAVAGYVGREAAKKAGFKSAGGRAAGATLANVIANGGEVDAGTIADFGMSYGVEKIIDKVSGNKVPTTGLEAEGPKNKPTGQYRNAIEAKKAEIAQRKATEKSIARHQRKLAQQAAKSGANIVENNATNPSIWDKAKNAASSIKDWASSKFSTGAESAKSIFKTGMNSEVANKIKDTTSLVKDSAKQGVEAAVGKIRSAMQTVIEAAGKWLPGKTVGEAVSNFCKKIMEKVTSSQGMQILQKKLSQQAATAAGGAALGIGAVAIGTMFCVTSFISGYNHAAEQFEVQESVVTNGMKVISGLVHAIHCAIGLIPIVGLAFALIVSPKQMLDYAIDLIGPAVGLSRQDLQKLQKSGQSVVDSNVKAAQEYGKGNPEINDNHSGGGFFDTVKETASGAWDKVKSVGSSLWESAKSGVSSLVSGAKSLGSSAWNGLTSLGSRAYNFVTGKGKHSTYGRGGLFGTGFHSQLDPAIAGMGFNIPGDTEKQTVKDSACGPMAMANALESVGVSVDDKDIIDKTKLGKEKNGGTPDYILNKYANNQGISTRSIGTSAKDLANSLRAGNPLVLMGQNDAGETDKDPFAENPHYVTATGLDKDGNVIIKDPESYQPVKTYKLRDIAQKLTIATELSKDKEPKFSEGASLKEIMAWKLRHAGRSKWGRERSNGNAELLWNYLKSKGLSNQTISGILGNFAAESGWRSSAVQSPSGKPIDSDTMTIDGKTGYGLAQWTDESRQQRLRNFLQSKGLQDSDYKGQLDFMLSGQDGSVSDLFKEMDGMGPEAAAEKFVEAYERPAKDSNGVWLGLATRKQKARELFDKEGKGVSSSSSFSGGSSSSNNTSTDIHDEEEQGIFGAISQLAKKLGSIINIFGDGSNGSSSGGSSGGGIGGANVKEIADKIIKMANAYANSPITYAMTNPVAVPPAKGSCDCSGMAMSCYKAGGIDITRTADTQYEFFKKNNAIYKGDMHQLQPADLVFTRNSSGEIDHVFVYIGNGKAVNMGQNHRERGNLAGLNSAGGDAVYYNGWETIKAGIDYHKGGAEFGSLTKLCSALGLGTSVSSSGKGYHGGDKRSKTTRIIIHHTSGSKTNDPDPSAAEINKMHTAPPRNWNCIGYHYVIRKNGSIEKGRNEDEIGAHAEGANNDSIGIHVGGEFMYFKPTEKQIESLIKLIQQLCKKYNIPIDRKHILGHREVGQTACPGDNLYNQLDSIVAKAAGSGKGKSRWGTGKPNVPDIFKENLNKFGRGKSKYGKGADDYKFSVPSPTNTIQHGGNGGSFGDSSKPFFNNDSLTKYADAAMKGETYQKYKDPITGKLLTAKDMEIAQKAGVKPGDVKKEDIKSLEEWNKAKEEGREVQVSAPENSVIDMAEQGKQASQTNLMDQFFGGVGSKLDAISEKLAPIKSALFSKLGSVISEKFGKFSNLIGDPLGMFKGFFGSSSNNSNSSADGSHGGAGGTFNGDATAIPVTGSAAAALKKALNCEITSQFGPRDGGVHHGIDYGIGTGTPVPTVTDGVIDDIGSQGGAGYGNYVVVKDKKGMYHIYAHLSKNDLAKKGDSVKAGQIIAKSGHSGHCIPDGPNGSHLHYGIYNNPNCAAGDGCINPNSYKIDGLSSSGQGKYGRGRLIKINPVKTKGSDRGGVDTKKYVPKSGKGKFKSNALEDLDITRAAIYPDFPKDIKSPDNTFGVTDEMIKQSKFGQGKYGRGFSLDSISSVISSIGNIFNKVSRVGNSISGLFHHPKGIFGNKQDQKSKSKTTTSTTSKAKTQQESILSADDPEVKKIEEQYKKDMETFNGIPNAQKQMMIQMGLDPESKKQRALKSLIEKKKSNSITKAQDDSKFKLGPEGSHGEGPNGKKYTNNDIAYILKNADKFGGAKTIEDAIKILEKDKRYTETTKKEDKTTPDSGTTANSGEGIEEKNENIKSGVTTPTQESSQKPSQAVSAQDKLDMLIEAQNKTNELLSAILNMAAKAMSIKESDVKAAEKTAKTNNKKINETSAMTKLNYFYNNSMRNSGVDTSFFNPDSGDFIDISKRMQKIASM